MVVSLIRAAAARRPEAPAYMVGDKTLTYAALWERAEAAAGLLVKQGTSPVILYGHKSPDMIVSVLACLIARRAYVPVEPTLPHMRVVSIVRASGATLALCCEGARTAAVECCTLEELARFAGLPAQTSENETAYIIFTSGSTGEPKGVPISVSNLMSFIKWVCSLTPLSGYRNAVVMNHASFSFDLSVADLYYALVNGHTLVSAEGDLISDPAAMFATLSAADVAVMTPTYAKLYLMDDTFDRAHFPRLRCIYFCGEPLETKTVRRLFAAFPDLHIINAYGPTEATCAVAAVNVTPEMAASDAPLPVGVIGAFATPVEIIDGEIVLKGESVFGGYLGGTRGGYYAENGVHCYRTGDLGTFENGMLYCHGRKDRQIKYKGYRIELDEIEANLSAVDGVKDCAVIAKYTDEGLVKTVQAFVEADPGVTAQSLRAALSDRVPEYMIPKTILPVEHLPVNQNGKTDRKALSKI